MLMKLATSRRLPRFIGAALAALVFIALAPYAAKNTARLVGYEAEWTAQQIIQGHGYSIAGNHRHLWYGLDESTIYPTAWVDPVFTYALAAAHWLFGDQAYSAIVVMNLLCLGVVLLLAYQLGARFGGGWTGVVAVALIVLHVRFWRGFVGIDNAPLASSLLLLTVYVAVRYFEQPTRKRLVVMGLMTGFAILACPAVQNLAYGVAIAVLVHHLSKHESRLAVARPVAMIVLAALVLAPWAIRNYLTFGEVVLVRNGAGQMAYVGTVAVAETFMPGVAKSALPAPWHASGPREAVLNMKHRPYRLALNHYQVDAWVATPPPNYEQMNEAQRDKLYFKRTKDFLREYPGVAAQMAVVKLQVFVTRYGRYGAGLIALAVIGGLLAIRDARSWPLSLAAASYAAPFGLIVAYYERYRLPIEPVLCVLSAVGIAIAAGYVKDAYLRRARVSSIAAPKMGKNMATSSML